MLCMYEIKKHHFHYISSYTVKFTKEFYPLASFEIRPFEFCTVEANSEFIHNLKINFGRVYPQCYVLKPFALVSIRAIKQIHVYCKAHEQFAYNSSQNTKTLLGIIYTCLRMKFATRKNWSAPVHIKHQIFYFVIRVLLCLKFGVKCDLLPVSKVEIFKKIDFYPHKFRVNVLVN